MIGFSNSSIQTGNIGNNGAWNTPPSFLPISIAEDDVLRVTSSSAPSVVTIKDAIYSRTAGAAVYTDKQLSLIYLGALPSAPTWASSNPAVATVHATSGFVTHLSSGSAVVTVTIPSTGQTLSITLSMMIVAGTHDTFTGWVSGTLAAHISDAVDSRIAGRSPSTALAMYSSQDHTTPAFTRNPNCWVADLGSALACISPSNSATVNLWAGVLISPRHVGFCNHAPPPVGTTMRFVTSTNEVISRTLTNTMQVLGGGIAATDLRIGVLDSDVPQDKVPFAKVLPSNWATKLPSINSTAQTGAPASVALPGLCLDQEEKALVTDLWMLANSAIFVRPVGLNKDQRMAFYEDKVGGDSGNPAFIIINNQLVWITCWFHGGAGDGFSATQYQTDINAAMATLGGGYSLTNVDISAFPSY